jgi:hypothetical protein
MLRARMGIRAHPTLTTGKTSKGGPNWHSVSLRERSPVSATTPHGRDEIKPAHGLHGRDELGKRPLGYRVADRLVQTLYTFTLLAHPFEKLFKCPTLLAILELLRSQPLHKGGPPRLLARIVAPEPQQPRRELLALALHFFAA